MKKVTAGLIALFSSTHVKAALVMGTSTAALATLTHADPWPWIVSAMGALIVTVKFPSARRMHGWINVLISVLAGGLSCDFLARYVEQTIGLNPGPYLMAFVISALWPAAVNAIAQLWPAIKVRAEKKIGGQS